jgi:CRP/FNR family transcriptional regulator, cyclic AMP receptor protein
MKLTRHHEIQSFKDGEIVVREGEQANDMFVIRSGRIEILKDVAGHQVRLAVLERGSFFGEMSLLEGLPRSATAKAIGDTTLLVLRPGSLLLQIRRDPTFAFELLQQMSHRIRELNDKLVFKVATAEFGNRLARSAFMMSAASEYVSTQEAEVPER